MRRSGEVPVKAISYYQYTNKTSIRNVVCEGTEENLSKCQLKADRSCNIRKAVQVQCARCTPDDLLGKWTGWTPLYQGGKTGGVPPVPSLRPVPLC